MNLKKSSSFGVTSTRKTLRLLFLTGAFVGLAHFSAQALTFDAKADYSTTNNVSGPWYYGMAITYGGSGLAEPTFGDITGGWGFAQNGWTGAGAPWENWAILSNTQPSLPQFLAGDLITHGNTSLAFVVPTTGIYQVDVSSWLGRDQGRTLLGKLMLNDNQGSPLGQIAYSYASGTHAAPASVFSGTISLSAGDLLRFDTVGFGGGPADFAGVNFTVTAVPEPSTVAVAVSALLGVMLIARRRQQRLA